MKRKRRSPYRRIASLLILMLVFSLQGMAACPVCFGETESGSEAGVNAAVWLMVGVTGTVLGLFSVLFFKLRRRMKMYMDGTIDVPSHN